MAPCGRRSVQLKSNMTRGSFVDYALILMVSAELFEQ